MARHISRRNFVGITGGALGAALLSACAAKQEGAAEQGSATTQGSAGEQSGPTNQESPANQGTTSSGLDYAVLVNWEHKLPDGWEANINLVEEKSLLYDEPVRTERKAYEAWRKLKEELAQEGVFVELDSCYRSVADQQDIWDEFTKKYGEEYVKSHVGVPGYSEHHTGLALDLFLVIDGRQVYENEEMVQHPEVWEKVHARLADHGFILRYLPRKAMFTHASYEPWHIRYLDDPVVARQIVAAGQTYEEYLGAVNPAEAGCAVDYGSSKIFSDADIDLALYEVLAEFETWKGCVMKRFAFAGDDACGAEELAYVNGLRKEGMAEFGQAIVLVTDFRSPSADQSAGTAWNPDTDYKDYTWHLGRTDAKGSWKLMTQGYA